MKSRLKDLGFTSGHVHLLLIAVALFAVLMVTQSNINIKALFVKADDQPAMLTYEGVHNQILADQGQSSTEADKTAEAQLALLDRSLDSGQVLGDSTGIGTVPPAEQIFNRDQLDLIHVTTEPTTTQSLQRYSQNLLSVESQDNAITMIANLNSSDPAVLKATQELSDGTIQNLASLTVPSELADFHRYKMIYYKALSSMAVSFAENNLNTDFQNTSKILFSIINKIEQSKSVIQEKYQIAL